MSQSKAAIWNKTLNNGLAMANKKSPFWTQSQAMTAINAQRKLDASK